MEPTSFINRHNEEQRNYFERLVKPTMVPTDTPYIRRHVEEVLRCAQITAADRVIEVGCGMGRYTIPMRSRGINVEGLDLSPVLLERLREFAGNDQSLRLHAADVYRPPSDLLGQFDAVIGFFTLHHLHDLDRCFASMRTLLKPGGRIVFLEPNAFNPLYYLQVALSPSMTWEGDKGIVDMRRGKIFHAMRSGGFGALEVRRFGFFPPFLANRPRGAAVEGVIERFPPFRPFLPFQLFRGVAE